eukprot:TRINITY_DN11384_c0_g1_i3.p1 TRINITY_DN11384_c0_g1~~TRINITY_DN11384_c0_g1_i3.p1  ORF type:complete len:111 (-),score=23.14 TRINITY_DN11384_c0_g1_i3:23-355(-)
MVFVSFNAKIDSIYQKVLQKQPHVGKDIRFHEYELEKKAIAIEDLKLILKTYEKSYQEHIPIQTTFKSDEIVYTLQIRNYTTQQEEEKERKTNPFLSCLLYTSPSPRDQA